jgi:ComF family protein
MLSGVAMAGRVGEALRASASRALDLALPATCAGCRREGSPLCRECRQWLLVRVANQPGIPIGVPADLPPPLLQLEWCAPFTGVVRRAIHQLKYEGERRLARPLGEAVAARWRRAGAGGDALVAVPASPDRIRERGYDHAALIAAIAGRELHLPLLDVLERSHDTTAQHALGRSGRARNVGGAFRLRTVKRRGAVNGGEVVVPDPRAVAAVHGRWIVLVDDVVTTGSTLAGCATALLDAGAVAVSAVTVARER